MSNNPLKVRGQLVPRKASMPIEARWATKAAEIKSPLSSFVFGVQARANMRALRMATEHGKVVGELMDIATETIGKIQRAQDSARTYAVRQELADELHASEVQQLLNDLEERKHQRTLAGKRRVQELVKADTEVLLARQTLRAKKKFEPLKHALGEERFKTEAARRRVGAAEAHMAIDEASLSGATVPQGQAGSQATVVSSLLEAVREELKQLRADDDGGERRAHLLVDQATLERMLAGLLSR